MEDRMSWIDVKPVPPALDPAALRILLFGRPKIGKSTWAASFPDALFLCPEAGHEHLELRRIALDGWTGKAPPYADHRGVTHTTFTQVVHELVSQNAGSYKTFVIDTADRLYKMCEDHVCKAEGISHPQDLKYGKGTDLVNNEFRRTLFPLINLRRGVIFISHTRTRVVTVGEVEAEKNEVSLPSGAQKVVMPEVDMILRADILADEKGNQHRVIVTQASTNDLAGTRWSLPPKFPMTKEGGYNTLLSYLTTKRQPPQSYNNLGKFIIKSRK